MKTPKLLLSLLIALFFISVNAQIVYTDINPDITSTLNPSSNPGSLFNLAPIDFNGDGDWEYKFRWDVFTAEWWMHMYSHETEYKFNIDGGSETDSFRYLKAMNKGESINSSLNWANSSDSPLVSVYFKPIFMNLGDKYVGVKFLLDTNTHYGWVLISFDNSNNTKKLIVKEYAYESTPNKAIIAGNKGNITGIDDLFLNNFSIYPNPAKNIITIDNKSKIKISKIKIINLLGKEIKEVFISNTNSQTIDISKLTKGIYLICLFDNEKKIGSKKLVIE